jgi:Protein of unknown function (DUF2782)
MSKRFWRPALAAALFVAWSAFAQTPPKLEPLPEPPPPPPGYEPDPSLEPQVTIVKRGEDVVEEFRINGRLYMIKITPKVGLPYYLVDYSGAGNFSHQDYLDPGIRPPMWVILEW